MRTRKTTYLDTFHAVPGTLNISEKLASIVKKDWSYEQKKINSIKKLHKKLLISQNCGKRFTPKLNREIFRSNTLQSW